MARHRLSEKEKAYFFCFLFPPFWFFIPVLIIIDIVDAVKNLFRRGR